MSGKWVQTECGGVRGAEGTLTESHHTLWAPVPGASVYLVSSSVKSVLLGVVGVMLALQPELQYRLSTLETDTLASAEPGPH